MRIWVFVVLFFTLVPPVQAGVTWEPSRTDLLIDDDIIRHASNADYLSGITVTQTHFAENGFNWHLIRFTNAAKPEGPLWVVPHDDENAAFESMIAALRLYGGTGIAVNSGPGSERRQLGNGRCGVRPKMSSSCDPNRNFSNYSPLFTDAFMDQVLANQPVIAIHTNFAGFGGDGRGGYGDVTILDKHAFHRGKLHPREDGVFGINQPADLANYDTLAIMPYRTQSEKRDEKDAKCGTVLVKKGIHFWHEWVQVSDGSLSNYIAFNRARKAYLNVEALRDDDIAKASRRHMLMIAAYMDACR
jgi:hypothetical protein